MSEASDGSSCEVSVVLPLFNEAEHLTEELSRIREAMDASSYSYEIIVVDDASTDGSRDLLLGLDYIRLVSFSKNRGSGSARKAGTKMARGDVVVWSDVDMTYPNDEIPLLVKELEGHDQVVGARRTEEGSAKVFRVPAKWLIRKLASYLAETNIPDLNSGFRAFRRSVIGQFLHMLPPGFSCVTTMTMAFLANGYSVKYVPIDYAARSGRSKFHWRKDTQRYLLQVIRLIMSYDPLRVFVPVGLALTALALGKLTFDFATEPFRVAINTLILFFTGMQAFAIGFIADLIVRSNKLTDEVPPAQR
ncbi:MAG: glycosyltransferase family 2 protein [Actinomycetota bacterium]